MMSLKAVYNVLMEFILTSFMSHDKTGHAIKKPCKYIIWDRTLIFDIFNLSGEGVEGFVYPPRGGGVEGILYTFKLIQPQ